MRKERLRLRGGDPACGNAKLRPHRERALERRHVALFGDQEEIADLMEVRIGADLIGESLDVRKRALRETDVDLARELQTDAAGILSRGSGPETVTLEHEDVANALLREVVRDRGTDDAATDNDDIGSSPHRADGMQSPGPMLLCRIDGSGGSGVTGSRVCFRGICP